MSCRGRVPCHVVGQGFVTDYFRIVAEGRIIIGGGWEGVMDRETAAGVVDHPKVILATFFGDGGGDRERDLLVQG